MPINEDKENLVLSTLYVVMLLGQVCVLMIHGSYPSLHLYTSLWLCSSLLIGLFCSCHSSKSTVEFGIGGINVNHLVFSSAIGPGMILLFLWYFIPRTDYVRLSRHRGFYVPTKEKNKEYVAKILSGKIKPIDQDGGTHG